jgi:hypothetical protein
MMKRQRLLAIAFVLALSSADVCRATIIVADTFTGAVNGGSLTGRTPETDLPGGNWLTSTNMPFFRTTTTAGFGNPVPGAFGGDTGQTGSAVSLASAGPYVKPTLLQISADMRPYLIPGSASAGRGLALGFYSSVGASQQYSQNLFTGLVLDAAGNLNLVHDPNATGFFTGPGSYLGTPVAYSGGTFVSSQFYRLSYQVDTVTGAISNISLSGSTADYSSLNNALFAGTATNYAGMYISGTAAGQGGLDNFQVSSIVPEPASLTLAGFALVFGACTRRKLLGRRSRSAAT